MFSFVFIIVGLFCRTLSTRSFTHKLSLTFVFFTLSHTSHISFLQMVISILYRIVQNSEFVLEKVLGCICVRVCVSASACGWNCMHYQVHLIVYILSALPFKSFFIIISFLFVSYFSSLGGFFLKSMYSVLFVVVVIRLLSSSLRMKGRLVKSCSH